MFRIKTQIRSLYASSVLGNLSLTGAWVAILAARGFSLVEIGLAETFYHAASLLTEIPSGTLADVSRLRIRRIDVDDESFALFGMVDDFFQPLRQLVE